MKFDQKYPYGTPAPYSDYRRLIVNIEARTFRCFCCGDNTNWILIPTMVAICSDECLHAQVRQIDDKMAEITEILKNAQERVKDVVAKERAGEHLTSEIMDLRLGVGDNQSTVPNDLPKED